MKLSMWILADWLESYRPRVEITDGQPWLTGVRLLSGDQLKWDSTAVLVGLASEFSPGQPQGSAVICRNGPDRIIIEHESVQTILNQVLEAFEHYSRWENALKEAAYAADSFQTLLDLGHQVFMSPMFISDWRGKVLAMTTEAPSSWDEGVWPHMLQEGCFPAAVYAMLKETPEQLEIMDHRPGAHILEFPVRGHSRLVHCTILHENDVFLHFEVIEQDHRLTQGTKHLAEIFMQVLAIRLRYIEMPDGMRPPAILFIELLSGHPVDKKALNRVLFTLGWQSATSWYLILFRSTNPDRLSTPPLLDRLTYYFPRAFCLVWEAKTIMLVSCEQFSAAAPAIERLLVETGFRCGVSMPFSDWPDLPFSLRQAEVALDYSDPHSHLNLCVDHVWSYLTHQFSDWAVGQRLLHPALGTLERYDAENKTELAKTLYEYLRNDRSPIQTAQALHLHRNSLTHRLARIQDLAGVNLDDPDVRLHIMLSYHANQWKNRAATRYPPD